MESPRQHIERNTEAQTAMLIQRHEEKLEQAVSKQQLTDLGYNSFFVFFALGAMLMIGSVFWPKRWVLSLSGWRRLGDDWGPRPPRRVLDKVFVSFSGAGMLLVLCAISHQLTVDHHRGFIADQPRIMQAEIRKAEAIGPEAVEQVIQSHYLYLPTGNSMRYMTLGNTAIGTDYMWLTSLQYISSPFRRGEKHELMHRFYSVMMDLDPHWEEVYIKAGKLLSALDMDRERSESFYERLIINNHDSWRIPKEAGLLYVVPPSDPDRLAEYSDKAAFYMELAISRTGMPSDQVKEMEDLIARLKLEAGAHEVAAMYLMDVATDKTLPDTLRERASIQWLQAESLVRKDAIQKLADEYKAETGHAVPYLAVLFGGRRQPLDAYGQDIKMDTNSGKVYSVGVRALRAIQSASMIESMLGKFKDYNDEFPTNLDHLTQFVRRYYRPPNDPPFPLLDALGKDMDCTQSPMGGPWDYNAEKGIIVLPPECNVTMLYINRKAAMEEWAPKPYRDLTSNEQDQVEAYMQKVRATPPVRP